MTNLEQSVVDILLFNAVMNSQGDITSIQLPSANMSLGRCLGCLFLQPWSQHMLATNLYGLTCVLYPPLGIALNISAPQQ